jgi:lipoprotein-releasing system permease protein
VIPKLKEFIQEGSKELEGDSVWLGTDLARKLHIGVGDKLTVYSPGNLGDILDGMKDLEKAKGDEERKAVDKLREVVLPKELTVTGIFKTGHYMHDSEFLLVPVHIGQELYGLGDALHGITVRTADPYGAEGVKKEIEKFLQPPQFAQTWIDMNNQFFEAVRLERTVMFFLLFFIILVAAFGIMNTLITVTVQKTRDIGVMKAIGANIIQIVGVFLGQGIIVGLFGTLMGLALGMTAVQYRNEFSDWLAKATGIEVFPRQVYNFSRLPAEVIPRDVAIICIGAFLICCLFAFLPAYRAARLDPVKALRYE